MAAGSIYDGLDFQVRRKERWCVMGVNGAGKSTLLKLVAGSTQPDDGTVALGASVKMGYFAQHAMDLLDGERTVFQSLEDAVSRRRGRARCARWPAASASPATTWRRNAGCCRAARRRGSSWRKMLFDPPNFLVLDEPTNHLDLMTKEMLITALSQYEGAMLFVSHDRHFLAALSNRVLELTPEGIHAYGGGYTEYVERTGHEAPGLHV